MNMEYTYAITLFTFIKRLIIGVNTVYLQQREFFLSIKFV